MKWTLIAFVLGAAASLACTATNNGGATANDLKNRQCSWPSTLDDAGAGGCHAAAALAECTNAGGAGCGCLTDSSLTCDGCQIAGVTCRDVCAANQFAIACGQIGPSTTEVMPPTNCTFAEANPGGISYYCCPCQ